MIPKAEQRPCGGGKNEKKKVNRQLSTKVDRFQVALGGNLMWCLRENLLSYSISFQLYYFQPNPLMFSFAMIIISEVIRTLLRSRASVRHKVASRSVVALELCLMLTSWSLADPRCSASCSASEPHCFPLRTSTMSPYSSAPGTTLPLTASLYSRRHPSLLIYQGSSHCQLFDG